MKYLNLTEGFNPFKESLGELLTFEAFTFPGGEPHIKLDPEEFYDDIDIVVSIRINSFNDLGLLLVAFDAINNIGGIGRRHLVVPYFPGARQDRFMNDGEALTLKVYADIINKLELNSVTVFDPHSNGVELLVDNCFPINNHLFVEICLEDLSRTGYDGLSYAIVSPDAGAEKKVNDLVAYLSNRKQPLPCSIDLGQHPDGLFGGEDILVKCSKTRDTKTGKLSGFQVYADNLNGKTCVIVDDICDGGGTFIGLAKELKRKGAGNLILIVSHGIFSKGFQELSLYFDKIYTTDSITSYEELFNSTVIPIENGMMVTPHIKQINLIGLLE